MGTDGGKSQKLKAEKLRAETSDLFSRDFTTCRQDYGWQAGMAEVRIRVIREIRGE
jgi:hypothetical protein